MRQSILVVAILLSACGGGTSSLQVHKPVAIVSETSYKEFEKQFLDEENYYEAAKLTVGLEHSRVVEIVSSHILQEMVGDKINPGSAEEILAMFRVDSKSQMDIGRKAYASWIDSDLGDACKNAAEIAYYFDLGTSYADKAISCAQNKFESDYAEVANVACRRPGSQELQKKLVDGWVERFERLPVNLRYYEVLHSVPFSGQFNFDYFARIDEYEPMSKIASLCPLSQKQYESLFAIGINDKKLEFSQSVLENSRFQKKSADYDDFISLALSRYECGVAAEVAIKYDLLDKVKAIFGTQKCLGGSLRDINLGLITPELSQWFFELSLKKEVFHLAYRIVKHFSLGDDKFDKVVNEALAARDYAEVLDFSPYNQESKEVFRDRVVDQVLEENEEWAMVNYLVTNWSYFAQVQRKTWVERAFLHALFRGAFNISADIAAVHPDKDFAKKGIDMSFAGVMKAENPEMARYIAYRHHLGNDEKTEVAKLYMKTRAEAERKKALAEAAEENRKAEVERKKSLAKEMEECRKNKLANDWGLRQCK